MEPPESGCALCGATWGDYWEEVEGTKTFFCCDVCARQYNTILAEAKKRTGWGSFDRLEMQGDYRGRACRAVRGADSRRFMISFYENGDVRAVLDLD